MPDKIPDKPEEESEKVNDIPDPVEEPVSFEEAQKQFESLLGEVEQIEQEEQSEPLTDSELEFSIMLWRTVSRVGASIDPVFELKSCEIRDLSKPTAQIIRKYSGLTGEMPPEIALVVAILLVFGPRAFVYWQKQRGQGAEHSISSFGTERNRENNLGQEQADSQVVPG